MDGNSQAVVTKVVSPKEITITCTFSTLKALNPVRKLSSTVHKVDAILKPLAKLVIVQHSLGFF